MSEDEKIKLLVVDDHPIVRDGIKARLSTYSHIGWLTDTNPGPPSGGLPYFTVKTRLHPFGVLFSGGHSRFRIGLRR